VKFFLKKEHVLILAYYTDPFTKQGSKRREKLQRSSKLLFTFLEAFSDPFVTAVEAASQSSPGTRAKLHKVEAAGEGLLLGESTEYAAS
jgi:hypothetical protein